MVELILKAIDLGLWGLLKLTMALLYTIFISVVLFLVGFIVFHKHRVYYHLQTMVGIYFEFVSL